MRLFLPTGFLRSKGRFFWTFSLFLVFFGNLLTAQTPLPDSLNPALGLKSGKLLLPPDFDPLRPCPLLVLMPYTGGNATDFLNKYLKEAGVDTPPIQARWEAFLEMYQNQYGKDRSFALLLTDGVGSKAHHNYTGFMSCIQQYEKQLARDFKRIQAKYPNIDPKNSAVGGVSLGGDLSWALSILHPEWFRGAIVTGSRCSYPVGTALPKLVEKQYAFFMAMGMSEAPERLSGMSYARKLLSAAGIQHTYREMPYLEHDRAPIWMFMEGIEFTLFQSHQKWYGARADSNLIHKFEPAYTGDVDIKKYKMEARADILQHGDGVWLEQSAKSQTQQTVKISHDSQYNLILQLSQPDFNLSLTAYLSQHESGDILLHIPEQDIKGIKYKGIAADINSLQHGVLVKNLKEGYFSFDIEKFPIHRPHERTTLSFFALLNQ